LRSDIEYGFAEAKTTFGIIGVKCWICHGEIKGKTRRTGEVTRSSRSERSDRKPSFSDKGDRKPFGDRPPRPFDPNRPRPPFDPNKPRPPFDPNRPRPPFDPNKPRSPRPEGFTAGTKKPTFERVYVDKKPGAPVAPKAPTPSEGGKK